jgi:hypothetical protein
MSWADVCKLALRLPGVTEGTSYGTPALHVSKRFPARLEEDGETMAIKMGCPERELLLELDPDAFFLTDHYRPYPAVLPFRSAWEAVGRRSGPSSCALDAADVGVTSLGADTTPVVG